MKDRQSLALHKRLNDANNARPQAPRVGVGARFACWLTRPFGHSWVVHERNPPFVTRRCAGCGYTEPG